MNNSKKITKLVLLLVIAILVACLVYFYSNDDKTLRFSDNNTGLSFSYQKDWGNVITHTPSVIDKDTNREGFIVKKGYKLLDFDGTVLKNGSIVAYNFKGNTEEANSKIPLFVYLYAYSKDFEEASGVETMPFYIKKDFDGSIIKNLDSTSFKNLACPKYYGVLKEISCKSLKIDGKPAYIQYIMRCGPQSPDCNLFAQTYVWNQDSEFSLIQVGFDSSYGDLNELVDDISVMKDSTSNTYQNVLLNKVREEMDNSSSEIAKEIKNYERFVSSIRLK